MKLQFLCTMLGTLLFVLFIHNVKTEDNQYFIETKYEDTNLQDNALYNLFCKRLKFTRSGMRCFLKHTFSHERYATDFLPYNLSHVTEFLTFGKESRQNRAFVGSTFTLFTNKIKACPYITAEAYVEFVGTLPPLLEERHFSEELSDFESLKNNLKRTLYSMFLSKFSFFKSNPNNFFDSLSDNILETITDSDYVQSKIDQERLRNIIVKFLEISLSKVMWNPYDEKGTWKQAKDMGAIFKQLRKQELIDETELESLYQSIVEQFTHFLSVAGSELSLNVIEAIKDEITNGIAGFLETEEQEEFIKSKSARLLHALGKTKLKVHALSRGIIA